MFATGQAYVRSPHDWVQAVLVRKSAQLLKKALAQTDERSKLEGEVIGGIDVVKCCAWEVCQCSDVSPVG